MHQIDITPLQLKYSDAEYISNNYHVKWNRFAPFKVFLHKKDHLYGRFKTGSNKVDVGFINDNAKIKKPIYHPSAFPEYNPLQRQKTPEHTRGALYRKFQLWTKRKNNNFSNAKDLPSPIKRRINGKLILLYFIYLIVLFY